MDQSALTLLGRRLAAIRTLEEAGRVLAVATEAIFRWDAFTLQMLPRGTNGVRSVLVMDTINGKREEIPLQHISRTISLLTARVIAEGPELVLRSAAELAVPTGDTTPFGDKSRRSATILCAPVRPEGRPAIGVVGVHSYTLNAFSRADLADLQTLVDHAAGALERVWAEAALREREASLQAIIEHTPNVAVQGYDLDGRVQLWNPASATLFGWSREEALGKTLDQLIHTPEEAAGFCQTVREIAGTGRTVGPTEYQFRRRNGQLGWCLSTIFEVPGDHGKPMFICMDVDVTAQRAAVESLTRAQRRTDLATTAANVALWEWNLITHVLEWSPNVDGMLAYPAGGFPRTIEAWEQIIHPVDRPLVLARLNAHLERSEPYDTTYRVQRTDGTWLWWHDVGEAQRDSAGRAQTMIGSCVDVTLLCESEARYL